MVVPHGPCPPRFKGRDSNLPDDFDFSDSGQLYCNSTWDTVSCWPTTLAGHVAVLSCPDEVDGFKYDTSSKSFFSLS